MFNFEGITTSPWKILLLFAVIVAIMAIAYVVTAVLERRSGIVRVTGTRELTYGAICLGASFALSFIAFYKMPYGGSITAASVLPIAIYCYYFGFRKSMVVCTAYMLLQFVQNPYIVSPWSALFDYVLPYLALAFTGLFSYKPALYERQLLNEKPVVKAHLGLLAGFGIYFAVRFFSHVMAGVLFWSSGIEFMGWVGDLSGVAALTYSMTYNAIFLVPDTIIAIVCGTLLLSSKAFNAFMAKSFHAKKQADTRAEDDERTGSGADEG